MKTEWMPIESAPRDGTDILVCDLTAFEPKADLAHWRRKWVGCSCDVANYCEAATISLDKIVGFYKPTHWMPLPEPPKVET